MDKELRKKYTEAYREQVEQKWWLYPRTYYENAEAWYIIGWRTIWIPFIFISFIITYIFMVIAYGVKSGTEFKDSVI